MTSKVGLVSVGVLAMAGRAAADEPAPSVTTAVPGAAYSVSLGVDVFAAGGRIGDWALASYGHAAAGIRIKGDYLVSPRLGVGAELYVQDSHVAEGRPLEIATAPSIIVHDSMDLTDLGVAVFKHLCVGAGGRVCITPLAGVAMTLISPHTDDPIVSTHLFNYSTFSGRVEINTLVALDQQRAHALSIAVGANAYADSSSTEYGHFIEGGLFAYASVGYAYRFGATAQTPSLITRVTEPRTSFSVRSQ